jgi:DNA-binding transcriptional regulator YiaG
LKCRQRCGNFKLYFEFAQGGNALRKPSFATALKNEVRRHSVREIAKTKLRLRKLQKEITLLRREARKDRTVVGRLKQKLGRVGARAASAGMKRKGDGPGRRTSPHTIKALRERLGMSRLAFAKVLGVSPGSIFGWESGRTTPRRESLAQFRALKKGGLKAAKAQSDGSAVKPKRGRGRAKSSGQR